MTESLQAILDFMTETAFLAGRLTLGYFQSGLVPKYKGDNSPVTLADRLAEELIRERIEKRYPDHAILGEEAGAKEGAQAEYRWIIDPIDGTKAFMRGVPLYGVLLGLEMASRDHPAGRIEAGVAYYPALDEMLSAATGLGCWWNGRRACVSPVNCLKESYISCTDVGGFWKYGRMPAFERLAAASYVRAGWSDAYGYMLVATGRIEVMLDPVMAPWDCGPFPVILREAGGYFGDWRGNETIYGGEGLATSRALLSEVLGVLGEGQGYEPFLT